MRLAKARSSYYAIEFVERYVCVDVINVPEHVVPWPLCPEAKPERVRKTKADHSKHRRIRN